jgi:hypothetical protein
MVVKKLSIYSIVIIQKRNLWKNLSMLSWSFSPWNGMSRACEWRTKPPDLWNSYGDIEKAVANNRQEVVLQHGVRCGAKNSS